MYINIYVYHLNTVKLYKVNNTFVCLCIITISCSAQVVGILYFSFFLRFSIRYRFCIFHSCIFSASGRWPAVLLKY